jgi:hypothetical protein
VSVDVFFLHPRANWDHVGEIPLWLSESDPDSAQQQIHKNYGHGGGWHPMTGFTMESTILRYPGDPPFAPLARMQMRGEMIYIYEYGIVAIVQKDGSFEAARID